MRIYIFIIVALFLSIFGSNLFGQNTLSVPFNSGFVGNVSGNNSASSCVTLASLGWSEIYFTQGTSGSVFVSQGNDIIGNVLIKDAAGVTHTIPGFVKWRAPSGSPTCLVFSPSANFTLSVNGGGSYNVGTSQYIGLIFNGQTLTISGGNVSGNASTNGLLDVLNTYLDVFPAITIEDYTVNESVGNFNVTITLSEVTSSQVSVKYYTSDGTAVQNADYTSTSGEIIFLANQVSKTVNIIILSDALAESDEVFYLNLFGSVNASILRSTSLLTITDNPPLPVELKDFYADCQSNDVKLKWETYSETNSDYFIVEKRTDASLNWEEIFKIPGAGHSTELLEYSFTDKKITNENVYYQLSQFDRDGKRTTYNPISLTCKGTDWEVLVWPNPSNIDVQISIFSSDFSVCNVMLLNMEGTTIIKESIDDKSKTNHSIVINKPVPGVYLLVVEKGGTQITKKVVVI